MIRAGVCVRRRKFASWSGETRADECVVMKRGMAGEM